MIRCTASLFSRSLLAGVVLFAFAAPTLADSPAAIRGPGQDRVGSTFDRFAATWMEKVQRLEDQGKRNPTVRPGASNPVVTSRGYGDDFNIELRPTGHASAPYVGLLRYSEHLYSCDSVEAANCTVASTVPVTEIFRFENGHWVY